VQACWRKPGRRLVHELRVDCRRLEALLDVLGHTTGADPKALRRLARLAGEPLDALSPLRDDQVQHRRISNATSTRGTDALLEEQERREKRHKKRARLALSRIDLAGADAVARRVRSDLVRRQGAPTPAERTQRLLGAVDAAAADVRSRLGRVDVARSRSLHKLRVALKRLRYVAEIAEEVSPAIRIPSHPTVRSLQRRLGHLHDDDVLAQRLTRFADRHRKHRDDVRAFEADIDVDRAHNLRGLSRSLSTLSALVADVPHQRTAR
jgi:CHAD domain-containing protein